MESPQVTNTMDLLQGVNESTDNLQVGRVWVSY